MNEKYLDKQRQQKHNHGCVAEVQTLIFLGPPSSLTLPFG